MSYVVNNHLDNLYVLSNKAVGPTSIPEARVHDKFFLDPIQGGCSILRL